MGDLQELLNIEITICDKLTTLPKSILNLPKLKEIIVRDCLGFELDPEWLPVTKIC